MSEEQQYQGERWTKETIKILSGLGWTQRGDKGMDIPCVKKMDHGTGKKEGKRKQDHGIDSLFEYSDPYQKINTGIIVESKRYAWEGIYTAHINTWVNQLLMTAECAEYSEKLTEYDLGNLNTGLLIIWCHETDKYNENKFDEYLKEIDVPQRKSPFKIFIASNREILRWCSLIQKVEGIKADSNVQEFKYFYPSDFFGAYGRTDSVRLDHINLTHMFSKYIFAKSKETVHAPGVTYNIDVNHIFFNAEPTIQELNFMYSLMQDYQLEDAGRINIYFYGEQTQYRGSIQDFLRNKREQYSKNDKRTEINDKYLNELRNIPAEYGEV